MTLWMSKPTLGFDIHSVMNLNYVVMGILAGIITVNVFKIPGWAENGVRLSRLGLKTGVVLLGVLYSWQELANLAGLSVVMIAAFVLGSVGMVLWMGARRNIPNSMGGVLSAGASYQIAGPLSVHLRAFTSLRSSRQRFFIGGVGPVLELDPWEGGLLLGLQLGAFGG